MKFSEIKKALKEGKTVHHHNPGYTVQQWGKDEYVIYSEFRKGDPHYVGFSVIDDRDLPEFYIAEESNGSVEENK